MLRHSSRFGFTLIELLVVIAVVAVLAAILFPVVSRSKAAAEKATTISNYRQVALGYALYAGDADDRFPVAGYGYGFAGDTKGPPMVALEFIEPYTRAPRLTWDPMDPASEEERATAAGDLEDPKTGPYPAESRAANLAYTSNFGLNFQALCPLTMREHDRWIRHSVGQGEVADPPGTLLGIDSVWWRRADGTPYGGGSPVDPPCVADESGAWTLPGSGPWYWYGGWNPSAPLRGNVYGGAWPWHPGGRFVVAWIDGHAGAVTRGRLVGGCAVKDAWAGRITDPAKYAWDLR